MKKGIIFLGSGADYVRARHFRRGSEWAIDSWTFEGAGCGHRRMPSAVGKIISLGYGRKVIISKRFSAKIELIH